MEIGCFAFDWDEVRKRADARAVVDEMILTDDIDVFATYLPDGMWDLESAIQYFEIAGEFAELVPAAEPDQREHMEAVSRLFSAGDSIYELGLGPLTEGCNFMSMSPGRVSAMRRTFSALDLTKVAELHEASGKESTETLLEWLRQWQTAVEFAHDKGLGLIGHCG